MLTFSVRNVQKSAQRSKLHAYQAMGKYAAEVRAKNRKPLDKAARMAVDHRSNEFEAFIHADDKNAD